MPYKMFVIEDPLPWLDQLIKTVNVMVEKCKGTSSEFVISQFLRNRGNPDHLLLAATEEGVPGELVGWVTVSFIHDTKAPWAEVWAMWCKAGYGEAMRDLARDFVIDWCREKGAVRIVSILTRSPRTFLKMFHESLGFRQVGIVIEKELKNGGD